MGKVVVDLPFDDLRSPDAEMGAIAAAGVDLGLLDLRPTVLCHQFMRRYAAVCGERWGQFAQPVGVLGDPYVAAAFPYRVPKLSGRNGPPA